MMNATFAPWRTLVGFALLSTTLSAAPFEPLFRLANPDGPCQVMKPGDATFEPARKGKAYPYGTAVRTGPAGSVGIILSNEDGVLIGPNSQIVLAADAADPASKVLRLDAGSLTTSMATGNDENALVIATPLGRCLALVGRGEIHLSADATAFTMDAVSSAGGSMRIDGPQFTLPVLKAGFSTRIVTARDQSLTRIFNAVGDYAVLIDKGGGADPLTIETSTKSTVRIWREHAPIGGRLIVSVLVTGSDGKGRECFAFAVGQPDVAANMMMQTEPDAATNAPADPAAPPEETAPPLTFPGDSLF